MRAKEDPPFSDFLLNLWNGNLQTESIAQIKLPPHIMSSMKMVNAESSELISNILPELQQEYIDPNILSKRAILGLRNEEVDGINELIIDKFLGKAITYNSSIALMGRMQ